MSDFISTSLVTPAEVHALAAAIADTPDGRTRDITLTSNNGRLHARLCPTDRTPCSCSMEYADGMAICVKEIL